MALKRKRSNSEISTSSNSILSSPQSIKAEEISYSSSFHSQSVREITPSHLSSRTRKRIRDNRPPEAKIHQHTLSILFSAQKNPQVISTPPQISVAPLAINDHTQQASLHSFWHLPSWPSSCGSSNASSSSNPPALIFQTINCEDCDSTLVSQDGDAMDTDMDIDMYGSTLNYACSGCGKQVCHQCAVSNLGADRRCLICAGKRTWVGGIGWMDQH